MKIKSYLIGAISLILIAVSGGAFAVTVHVEQGSSIHVTVPNLGQLPGIYTNFKKSNGKMASGYISVDWALKVSDSYETINNYEKPITAWHPLTVNLSVTGEPYFANTLEFSEPQGDGPLELIMPNQTYELSPEGYYTKNAVRFFGSDMEFKIKQPNDEDIIMEPGVTYQFTSPAPVNIHFSEDQRTIPVDQVDNFILPPEVCGTAG